MQLCPNFAKRRRTALARALAFIALLAASAPASAHHKQTPPIVAISGGGDVGLPRLPAGWRRCDIVLDNSQLNPTGWLATPKQITSGHQILREDWFRRAFVPISAGGENANPTIDVSGFAVAWDTDCSLFHCASGDPGRQIILWQRQTDASQATHDPTGTSVNPALDGKGDLMAFESLGDLAGTGNNGVRQIFLRDNIQGVITQLTHGQGTSQNAALSQLGRVIVFESTTDPASGADTGISQVWMAHLPVGPSGPITAAAAPSRLPGISPDERFVVFESTADVAGDGHDTGVNQIFVYDVRNQLLTQLTNDPLGCSGPSIDTPGQWRVAFVCHGEGFFQILKTNTRYQLPIVGGDTQQVVAEGGTNFIMVSTTANLLTGGTTAGHQLYRINLFKLPAIPVGGGGGTTTTTSPSGTTSTSTTTTTVTIYPSTTGPTTSTSTTSTTTTAPTSTTRPRTTTTTTSSTTTTLRHECTPATLFVCDDGNACTIDRCTDDGRCAHDTVTAPADLFRVGPDCVGQFVPSPVGQQYAHGCSLFEGAMGQPPLKRKKMLTKAARAFKQAGTMADRAGLRKKAPISPACASALHSLLNSARDQSQTAKLGQ